MSDIAISSSTQTSFTIPKLRDDGSNWTDYEPRVKNALGAKGLWKHADGRARQPVPLVAINGVLMARGSTTTLRLRTRLKPRRRKWMTTKRTRLTRSTSSFPPLLPVSLRRSKMNLPQKMWDAVVADVKNKSTLQQLDLVELLQSMRLDEGSDATTHLTRWKLTSALWKNAVTRSRRWVTRLRIEFPG
jgi:hypothetical protein